MYATLISTNSSDIPFIKNSPFIFDADPCPVPTTMTLAPISGSLVLESIIFPFNTVDWSATNPEKASIMHNFIFISFIRFTSQQFLID